jgi:hypothetical protein
MGTLQPASSAAPGLSITPAAVIARQRGHVAFAVMLTIAAVVAIAVDEAGRWTEATPLGFTLSHHDGQVMTVDPRGPAAALSTTKSLFPMLTVRTPNGHVLWGDGARHRLDGIVVDDSGEVLLRRDTPAVHLHFFASRLVARGEDGCLDGPNVDAATDDVTDEEAVCTRTGRIVVFTHPTAASSASQVSPRGSVRLVRIRGGGTTLWAGLLLSVGLAGLAAAVARRLPLRIPDDDDAQEQLRRHSIMLVVMAVGLVVPLLGHACFMVLAVSANQLPAYLRLAVITTALPHLLMLFHLRRSANAWLDGDFATTSVSAATVAGAVCPGIIFIVPPVVVLVVAAVLHRGLRGWARQSLEDNNNNDRLDAAFFAPARSR